MPRGIGEGIGAGAGRCGAIACARADGVGLFGGVAGSVGFVRAGLLSIVGAVRAGVVCFSGLVYGRGMRGVVAFFSASAKFDVVTAEILAALCCPN